MIWSIDCRSFVLGSAFVFLLFQNKIKVVYICNIWKYWHYRDLQYSSSHSLWRAYIFMISVDLQFPMDALFDEISRFKIRKLQVYVFEKHLVVSLTFNHYFTTCLTLTIQIWFYLTDILASNSSGQNVGSSWRIIRN